MREMFQTVLLRFVLCGLAASVVLLVLRSRLVRDAFARLMSIWRSLTAFGRVAVCSFLLIGILIGGDKTNSVPPNMNSPLPQMQQGGVFLTGFTGLTGLSGALLHTPSSLNPVNLVNPVQNNFAQRKAANWNIRGAWKDSFWLPFDDGWVFPWGTNHLSGVEVVSYGQIWATPFDTNAVVSVGLPFEIVRGLTTFGYEFTPSNSYRFVWTDAAINRDTNNLVTAALELFRNGNVSVTTNGVAALLPRELPFSHNGFGQDDEWVMANFTNATEILAVGYPQWVDAQVGEGLTNGLYKFTVTIPGDPPETVQLGVGDLSVAVTNAGEYVFLLEKGIDYEYGIIPFMTNVSYSAVDDVPQTRGVVRGGQRSSPGDETRTWTVDGGYGNEPQTEYALGRVWWLPFFFGSPDVSHIGPDDETQTFTANFADCRQLPAASYLWTASDGLTVHSPNAHTTQITVDSMPSWAQANISVTATIGGHELNSYLDGFTYGTNDTPQVHLSLDAPDTILVYTNIYTNAVSGLLSLSMTVDRETNGILCLDCVQNAERVLLKDDVTGTTITLPCQWPITSDFSRAFRVEGLVASETCGDVVFLGSFVSVGGDMDASDSVALTVADVWHLAVSEEPKERCRNTLGVGESVIFYYRPRDIQIASSATSGEFLSSVDGMLPYYAPYTQDVSNVALSLGEVTCNVPFSIIEPQGMVVESVETNAYEFAGYAGIFEMTFHNRLVPTNVSFYAIETIEIPLVATNAIGYYAQPDRSDELDHGKRGGGNWGGVGYGNEYIDHVAAGYVAPPWGDGGSFTWPIPVAWRGRHDEGVTNVFYHADQRFELDANGTVRVFKFGYCGERTTNNIFSLTRIIP